MLKDIELEGGSVVSDLVMIIEDYIEEISYRQTIDYKVVFNF